MKHQSGNALFLILIAVALFAALSYALTSSGRGSGNIDREQADIIAARILSQISDWESRRQRLELLGIYDEVLYDNSAENNSATCINSKNGTTYSPCTTIGMFHPDVGGAPPFALPERDVASDFYLNYYEFILEQRSVSGTVLGTTLPDRYIYIASLPEEVCKALNAKLLGTRDTVSAVISSSFSGDTYPKRTTSFFYEDAQQYYPGTISSSDTQRDFNIESGCLGGGYYEFYYFTEIN